MKIDSLAPSVLLLCLASSTFARADIPPPPGQTRVNYQYRVDSVPDGKTVVAYSTYNPKDNKTHAVVMLAGVDQGTWQGYRPGIYVLSNADAAKLPNDDGGLEAYLAAHALLCLKQVPRVFQVATKTRVTAIADVIHVEVVDGKCEARLAKTTYSGSDGKSGEGGVDANGKRTPPAPFGADLPSVSESGFVLTPRRATK